MLFMGNGGRRFRFVKNAEKSFVLVNEIEEGANTLIFHFINVR